MKTLDERTRQHIVDLLGPLMTTEGERRALLILTLFNHPLVLQLEYTGSTQTFTLTLIDRLYQFGKLDDGRPVLWALLEVIREQVGLDQKHRIDALRPVFDLPPPARLDHLFVSYSRKNEPVARLIVSNLKDAGLRVWYDRENIKGGEDWWASIAKGITTADYFIFCLSPDSIRSKVARNELLTARQHNKMIFAIMLEDCLGELNDEFFADIHWLPRLHIINFTRPETYGANLRELIQSLPGYTPPDPYYLEQIEPRNLPNPFRGLEAFLEVEAAYFAGREDAVKDLLARVQASDKPRLLAVVGTSGSGKSSLVRAGLIPAIHQTLPFWETLTIKPGSQPLDELADRLQERLGVEAAQTRERLDTNVNALDNIAAELMSGKPDNARFVLVIDQFEELFTRTGDADRETFLNLLLQAISKPNGRVYIILTLRSDFFDRLSAIPALAQRVRENLDITTEMMPDQLRRSMEDPARKVGLSYEAGLVDQILEDVRSQPGSLPLLQYALKELFERKLGRRMTHEAYDAIGGIKGALATRADAIYDQFNADHQDTLRRVLLRLVEVGDDAVTRSRVTQSDLHFAGSSDETVRNVLDRLTDPEARLLIVSAPLHDSDPMNDGEIFYEVSHEALLTHWQRLADWISENRDDLRRSSDILIRARAWESTGRRDMGELLKGGRLIAALDWLERTDATELQRAFVKASEAFNKEQEAHEFELQRRALNRTRLAAVIFGVFLVISLGLLIFSLDRQYQADRAAATSVANAIRADNNAGTSDSNVILAVAAQKTSGFNENMAATQAAIAGTEQHRAEVNATDSAYNAATAIRQGDEAESLLVARRALEAYENGDVFIALALAQEAVAIPSPPAGAQEALYSVAYSSGLKMRFDKHTDSIIALYAAQDSKQISSVSVDGTLFVWNRETGEVISETSLVPETIKPGYILSASFTQDGTRVMVYTPGNVILWNLDDKSYKIFISDYGGVSFNGTINSDGHFALIGFEDGHIEVWDLNAFKKVRDLKGHFKNIMSLSFIPGQSNRAVSTAADGQVILWNLDDGYIVRRLALQNQYSPTNVTINAQGHYAAFTLENSIYLWNLSTGEVERELRGHRTGIYAMQFSPDGSKLLSGGGNVITGEPRSSELILWDVATGQLLSIFRGHANTPMAITFTPDGRYSVSGSGAPLFGGPGNFTDSEIIVRDLLDGMYVSDYGSRQTFNDRALSAFTIRFSPDGQSILTGYGLESILTSGLASPEEDLMLRDVKTGQILRGFDGHKGAVTSVEFSSDGHMAVTGSEDGTAIVWNLWSGEIVHVLKGHTGTIWDVDYSNDGQFIITASNDSTLILWNADTGEQVRTLVGHTDDVRQVEFLPHSLLALSGSGGFVGGKELILWNVETGEEVRHYLGHTDTVWDMVVSQDGQKVFSISCGCKDFPQIIVWDINTGEQLLSFTGHHGMAGAIALSPDGSRLVTGSQDGSIILWDADTGEHLREFQWSGSAIQSIDFAPNGELFAVSYHDGMTALWRLDSLTQLISWTTQNLFVSELECDERSQYRIRVRCNAEGIFPTRTLMPTLTPTLTPTARPTVDYATTSPTPTLTYTPTATNTLTPREEVDKILQGFVYFKVFVPADSPYYEWVDFRGPSEIQSPASTYGPNAILLAPGQYALEMKLHGLKNNTDIVIIESDSPYNDLGELEKRLGSNLPDPMLIKGTPVLIVVNPQQKLYLALFIYDQTFVSISITSLDDKLDAASAYALLYDMANWTLPDE